MDTAPGYRVGRCLELKFSEVASPRPSSAGSTDLDLHQLVRIGYEDASGFANHPVGVDLGALLLILATFRNGRLNFRFFQEVECLLPRNCCYTGCYSSACYGAIPRELAANLFTANHARAW